MKITVIGTGYVGLVTGTCFAQVGNDVVCLDVDEAKIEALNNGIVPIYEPGLAELLSRNRAAGRLAFTNDVARATAHGSLQFIAVGTPSDGDGSADLTYCLEAARSIARFMDEPKIVVNKSTVPVGAADQVRAVIRTELRKRGRDLAFSVVSNPEFLKEGAAVEDFMRPSRIIVGAEDQDAVRVLRQIYAPINRHHEKFMVMDTRSAELTKYAANAMLATRISFMNELAGLADAVGADIEQVRQGIGSDPRIGYDFLYAGCGFGGSCFPKDVRALVRTAEQAAGERPRLLSAVESINNTQRALLGQRIRQRLGDDLAGLHFALWGLAFKPGTDDMREATSRVVIDDLLAAGAALSVYDPVAMDEARRIYKGDDRIQFADTPMAALDGAEALVIVTEWTEFRSPDFEALKKKLKQPLIFDGRNLFEPVQLRDLGIEYHTIGRNAHLRRPESRTKLVSQ